MNVVDMAEFYASPLGKATARIVSATLKLEAVAHHAEAILALGFGLPFIPVSLTAKTFALMPARMGVLQWPPAGQPVRSLLVDEHQLPFADNSIDVMLVVHGLEFAETPLDMLEEIWRVLAPQGKLLLIVANRRGLWAAADHTPLGQGLPYSKMQLQKLLHEVKFAILRNEPCLFMPPIALAAHGAIPRFAETVGKALSLHLAGAHFVEAQKQVHAYVRSARSVSPLRRFRPILLPSPQPHKS